MLAILILCIIGNYWMCEAVPNASENEDLEIDDNFEGNIEDFPYTAHVERTNGRFMYGATIIHPSILVTAAHCTFVSDPKRMAVRVGTSYRGHGGQLVPVKHVETNSFFEYETMNHDVSLLWLEHPLQFNSKVQPIKLPKMNESLLLGTNLVSSGWGITNNIKFSRKLEHVFLQVADYQNCNVSYLGRITKNMFCASIFGIQEKQFLGFSGNPLVANNTLVGITSWRNGIDLDPMVFTNLAMVREWIDSKIQENSHLLLEP